MSKKEDIERAISCIRQGAIVAGLKTLEKVVSEWDNETKKMDAVLEALEGKIKSRGSVEVVEMESVLELEDVGGPKEDGNQSGYIPNYEIKLENKVPIIFIDDGDWEIDKEFMKTLNEYLLKEWEKSRGSSASRTMELEGTLMVILQDGVEDGRIKRKKIDS